MAGVFIYSDTALIETVARRARLTGKPVEL